jgi:hypothetical protein
MKGQLLENIREDLLPVLPYLGRRERENLYVRRYGEGRTNWIKFDKILHELVQLTFSAPPA